MVNRFCSGLLLRAMVCVSLVAQACGGTSLETCTQGETRCNGARIEQCAGGEWVPGTDCAQQDQNCEILAGQARCVDRPPVCQAGQSRCNFSVVEDCVDGIWVAGGDCDDSGQVCEIDTVSGAAGCVDEPIPCTEAETHCNGNTIETCTNEIWVPGEDCTSSEAICEINEVSGEAECVEQIQFCTEGATRCNLEVIETCTNEEWVPGQDCSLSDQICEHDDISGSTTCEDPDCTDGATRCEENVVEACAGGIWSSTQDCDDTWQTCEVDDVSGEAACAGLAWIHLAVEIDDPIVNGTSLMMPIDAPSFAFDPERDLFVTQYGRNYNEPEIAHLWFLDGVSGSHYKTELSGEPFAQNENFCSGGEDWCQLMGFDPVAEEWIVVAPSAPVMMKVSRDGVASLTPVSGSMQPDSYIDRTHRFDWVDRKLFLYGAIGPDEFSHAVYELDLDLSTWSQAVSGLEQVNDNCLVYVSETGELYSFAGQIPTVDEDGNPTTELLSTYDVIGIETGLMDTVNLPAGIGGRKFINCAYDGGRGLVYLYGGSVVNDRFNEIENEYHNDLWVLNLSDDSWSRVMPDTEPGIFLEPDEYGDRRFEGDVRKPNFGLHRGHMEYDATNDRLVIIGEVPIYTHQQPYFLYLDGIEALLE